MTRYPRITETALAVLICLVFTLVTVAQRCPVDYGKFYPVGGSSSGRKLKSWDRVNEYDQLPQLIGTEVRKVLIERVGKDFMTKIRFDGAMLNDYDSKKSLSAKDTKRIDEYEFYFSVIDEAKGLKAFHFTTRWDFEARLKSTLELPDIRTHPEKGSFIRCDEAVDIAKASGVPAGKISIYFAYDAEMDAFVWDMHDGRPYQPDEKDANLLFIPRNFTRHVYIDASTGKVVRSFNEFWAF